MKLSFLSLYLIIIIGMNCDLDIYILQINTWSEYKLLKWEFCSGFRMLMIKF